jgi:hypothetical protein
MNIFRNKLKMKCSISRLPENPTSLLDDGGMFVIDFEELYTDIKCYLQYLRLAGGKFLIDESGQEGKNEIVLFLSPNEDVLVGDRINCPTFYPYEFYVDSINPIINARTGINHHFECILSLERKN